MALTLRNVGRQYDKDNMQAAIYAPPIAVPTNAVTAVSNRGFLMRVAPSRDMAIVSIAFVVSTAASLDDPVDVGIYSATGVRLVSSGATTGKLNATGVKTVTVTSTALAASTVYYAALSFGTVAGTAAVITGVSYQSVFAFSIDGAGIGLVEADAKATQHPLPAPWGALSGLTAIVPWVALKES